MTNGCSDCWNGRTVTLTKVIGKGKHIKQTGVVIAESGSSDPKVIVVRLSSGQIVEVSSQYTWFIQWFP